MARGKSNGVMYPNPFNETGGGEEADVGGDRLYYTYDEAIQMQLQAGDLSGTPNTRASAGILGGPAAGEANPAGLSPTGGKGE